MAKWGTGAGRGIGTAGAVTRAGTAIWNGENHWNTYDLVAFIGLAVLIVVSPFFRGLFFPEDQVMAMLWAAPLLAYGVWVAARRGERFFTHAAEVWAFMLPLAYLCSSLVAINPGLAVNEIIENTLYFIVFWVSVRTINEPGRVNWLLAVLVTAAAAVALTGLAAASNLIYIKDGFWGNRICSTFQYPNSLASYLAAVFLAGIYLFDWLLKRSGTIIETGGTNGARETQPAANRLLLVFIYLLWTALYLIAVAFWGTQSQGGTLFLTAGIVIFLFLYPPERRLTALLAVIQLLVVGYLAQELFIREVLAHRWGTAWSWVGAGLILVLILCWLNLKCGNYLLRRAVSTKVLLIGLIVVLGAGGVYFLSQPQLLAQIKAVVKLHNAFQRFTYIEYAVEMIKQRPLLGWGGGGWSDAWQYFFKHYNTSTQVHSYYFQLAVETGLIGLAVVLAFIGSLAAAAVKLWRCRGNGTRENGEDILAGMTATAGKSGEKGEVVKTGKFISRYESAAGQSTSNNELRPLAAALITAVAVMYGHAAIDFDLSLAAVTMSLMSLAGALVGVYGNVTSGNKTLAGKKWQANTSFMFPTSQKTSQKEKKPVVESVKGRARRGFIKVNYTTLAVGGGLSLSAFILAAVIATANSYAASAIKMAQAGLGREALSYAKKAQAIYPLNADFDALVAGLLQAAGDLNGAEENMRKAVQKSWYSPKNHIELAKILVRQKKYREAVAEADTAVNLAPLRMETYEAFARLAVSGAVTSLVNSGGRNEDVIYLAQAIVDLPGRMLARHKQVPEDKLKLSSGKFLNKPSPVIMLAVGEARAMLGDYEQAIMTIRGAVNGLGDDKMLKGEAHYWLAMLYERTGNSKEAEVNRAKAKELWPEGERLMEDLDVQIIYLS